MSDQNVSNSHGASYGIPSLGYLPRVHTKETDSTGILESCKAAEVLCALS